MLEQLGRAMLAKGYRLGDLGRHEDEIFVYDKLLARFGDHDSPDLRESVGKGMIAKSIRLADLGRSEEAAAVYEQLGRRL